METADESGEYVAMLWMVIVIGTIKIGGHDGNEISAILSIEEFTVFQTAYLG